MSRHPVVQQIGPCAIQPFVNGQLAVRSPSDFEHLVQRAGGIWEPGSKRWLVERRRIRSLVRALQRETDPLFRRAGLSLDEQSEGRP